MAKREVKITTVLQSLIPNFVNENYPLLYEFLKSYYTSLSKDGSIQDIVNNIDHYLKLDTLSTVIKETSLNSDLEFYETSISVESTDGFSNNYGLIQINSEVILYEYKTETSFENCIRGFSGITSYDNTYDNSNIVFETTNADFHEANSIIKNLDVEFLNTFFKRLKYQYAPGLNADNQLNENLNQNIFIQHLRDFYSSKGTDESFRILFRALYNKDVEIIKPIDYVFRTSDSQYRITRDLIVESINGDPLNLVNQTIFQNKIDGSVARGTVTNVEQVYRANKIYYQISLDYDFDKDIDVRGTIFGEFEITPSTTILNAEDTYLDVDSTLNFPEFGFLVCDDSVISYQGKTSTQFLNCIGIPTTINNYKIYLDNSYGYGYSEVNSEIRFRITGVLFDLNIPSETYYLEKDDVIQVKCLGEASKDVRANNWLFNIVNTYKISSLTKKLNFVYEIVLHDNHIFNVGDTGEFIDDSQNQFKFEVIELISNKILTIKFYDISEIPLNIGNFYIKRNISKFNSKNFPDCNIYSTNVQNCYLNNDAVYVSASSLPTYSKLIETQSPQLYFSGSYSNLNIKTKNNTTSEYLNYLNQSQIITTNIDHGILTGSEVSISIQEFSGIYFAYSIEKNKLKLAKSREALFNVINAQNDVDLAKYSDIAFIKFEKDYNNEFIVLAEFVDSNFNVKPLNTANLISCISTPKSTSIPKETPLGATGILINGVEIQNYKSLYNIFYGPIEEIYVNDSDSDFDVINPPSISILDSIGIGASANVCVSGGLNKIIISNPGFDYIDKPIVKISGGGGVDCDFSVNLKNIIHIEQFNSTAFVQVLGDLSQGIVGIGTYHKFRSIEKVVYRTNNQKALVGLSTNAEYYISSVNSTSIKLFKSIEDCKKNINSISISNYGEGIHYFEAVDKKSIIDSITVLNSGFNYKNQKTTIFSESIDISLNTFYYKNHNYKTGEIVVYTPETSSIVGLSSTTQYKIEKISQDTFKLKNKVTNQDISLIGISTNTYHSINYSPIVVDISYKTEMAFDNYAPKLDPIFTGKIYKVNLISKGKNYGSSKIVNHNRQPIFQLTSGFGAQIYPIINNGKIIEVIVSSQGDNYESIPDIIIEGPGYGAILTPIIQNKKLIKVKVINSGLGYKQNETKAYVKSRGSGAGFEASIQKWTINLFEYLSDLKKIPQDEGFLLKKSNFLQYSHLCAPKELRQIIFATKIDQNGEVQYQYDIKNDETLTPTYHSPIIGWAYDGNPIYGPYGFIKNANNSTIVGQLKSNYALKLNENRPPTYKLGYFVEDYVYEGVKDEFETYLDEHNGRYCSTPEFPNGTYAYFATIDSELSSKSPVFPYLIGNSYKFDYIDQNNINISNLNLIRNTTPYGVLNENTITNHFLSPNDYIPQKSIVTSTKLGKIENINVINSGFGYKVGDIVQFSSFDNTKTSYKVSNITGKDIQSIVGITSSIDNIEVKSSLNSNLYEFHCDSPHLFKTNDIITISQQNIFKSNQSTIKVNPNILSLRINIDSYSNTGIITYIPVYGNLNVIRPDDIYSIKNEQIKILNVDFINSRLRVIRNYNSTIGVAYSTNTSLLELPRVFYFDKPLIENRNYSLNDSIYFNPKESLGLGRTFGVGIVSTLNFTNPGSGVTSIEIPTRTIYIPNHSIENYVEAKYILNGYTGISVSVDGISDFTLTNNSKIYLNRITDNLVGISTVKVGLNTLGVYVGIQTTGSLLYLISSGTGEYHKFLTNKDNVLKINVSKNYARVTTQTNHQLQNLDIIDVKVNSGLTTEYKVEFNSKNKKIALNKILISSSGINTANNTIEIQNHIFNTGDKVIYSSITPSVGLSNNQIYFIHKIDSNNIGLKLDTSTDSLVDIQSQSNGFISLINPEINVLRNSVLSFDVSDSSLASNSLPAFDLKFYEDAEFNKEYTSLTKIQRINFVGINTQSKVKLIIDKDTPKNLYYKFINVNLNYISEDQKKITIDNQVKNNSRINIIDSVYSGKYSIFNATANTFDYNLNSKPEILSYNASLSQLSYITQSKTATGGIVDLNLNSVKNSYKTLPGIGTILSQSGTNAIIYPVSKSIGKLEKIKLSDIGFEYPYDSTLRPTVSFPQVLKIDPLNSISKINILSYGIGYSIYPDLILIDGFTNKVVTDVNLKIDSNNTVKILNNTKGIYNAPPKLIPINNSNGVGINSISYNSGTNNVTVTLNASYSNLSSFPFAVGDNVLIENVQIVETDSNYKNYNSSEFNYLTFKITQVNPNLGGSNPTIVYSYNANFGTYNNLVSIGRVIPEKYFPQFEITLSKNLFFAGEMVEDVNNNIGYVIKYDEFNSYLKILSNDDFKLETLITGKSSRSVGLIKELNKFKSDYNVKSSSIVDKGWNIDYITPSNNLQRLHDNDYYQYFSYSIKSSVGVSIWNDTISNLNHPAGFKKFSNLIIESKPVDYTGISTVQPNSVISPIKFLTNHIDLNCSTDFDIVNENYYYTPDIVSNEINFNSQIIQDYSESIGNRVLNIDDISGEFNSRQNLNVVNSFRI